MNAQEINGQVVKFYSIREASKMMGIGYNSFLGAVKHGSIRFAQIGTDRRVSVSAMNEFARKLETGEIILKTT